MVQKGKRMCDHYAGRDERRHPPPPLAHEREEPTREMFLTEKEYRSYGLRGERRISDISSHAAPALDHYWKDYGLRDVVRPDPVPSSGRQDYQPYSFDTRREYPLADMHPDYHRMVNIPFSVAAWMESHLDLHRREVDPVDRVYGHSQHRGYDLRLLWRS
ncbi:hypothetical protein SAY87_029332 [Trapa incisa]|uniref:Uncharacterized protein n=1 Tax=Trapa incisa TaxID=236973 RepID=A0AAN7Q8M5_9MYRT|nr:hypothetical protein SAY87_029332 [Trapa incisa]